MAEKKKSVLISEDTWFKLKFISMTEAVPINKILENLVDRYVLKQKYKIPKDD